MALRGRLSGRGIVLPAQLVFLFALFFLLAGQAPLAGAVDEGVADRTPWSGYWWSLQDAALAFGYQGHPAPFEKYDWYADGDWPSWATNWEADEGNGHYQPNGESWFGHCNGWSAAAVRENEPGALTAGGIPFDVGDLKGILSEAHYQDNADFEGERYGDGYGSEDIDDLYPDHLWLICMEYIRDNGLAIVMDLDEDYQVWNYPVYQYYVDYSPANDGYDGYWCDMRIWAADDAVSPDFEGTQDVIKDYSFYVRIVGGEIVSGSGYWYGDAQWDHPDFAWYPTLQQSANPYIEYSVVTEILSEGPGGDFVDLDADRAYLYANGQEVTSVGVGEDVELRCDVYNRGNQPANGWHLECWLDGELFGSGDFDLGGNESEVFYIDWTATEGDQHIVEWKLDTEDSVEELHEDNNQAQVAFSVGGAGDVVYLYGAYIEEDTDDDQDGFYESFYVVVDGDVANQGDAQVYSIITDLSRDYSWYTDPWDIHGEETSDNAWFLFTIGDFSLTDPAEIPLKVELFVMPDSSYAGSYSPLQVPVDDIGDALPDLVAERAYFWADGHEISQPNTGQSVELRVDVSNPSIVNAYLWRIEVWLDDELYGDSDYMDIPAGETYTYYIDWVAEAGFHTVKWIVDSEDAVNESNENNNEAEVTATVGIEDEPLSPPLPTAFAFSDAYPNPFVSVTTMRLAVPELPSLSGSGGDGQLAEKPGEVTVTMDVYNLRGQRVRTIVSKPMPAGYHQMAWDGRDGSGAALPSGTYLVEVRAGDWKATRKVVLTK
jgi:hypothetical protein